MYYKFVIRKLLFIPLVLLFPLILNGQVADSGHKAVLDFRPAIGMMGVFGGKYNYLIVDLQITSSQKFWILKPVGGIIADAYGDIYFYGGINIPFSLAKFLELGVCFAPGFYYKGQGADLGFPIEFRSSVNLSYVFPGKSAIGIEFSHISNAGLGYQNPGIETLTLSYRFTTIYSSKGGKKP